MMILHLCGFLGADPEERYTNDGQKLWTLRLAVRSYKNGQETTVWWRVTVWGDQFDNMLRHFKKGKPIYVVAEMKDLDTFTNKNGETQVSYDAKALSLHFLPMGDRNEAGQQGQGSSYGAPQQQQVDRGSSPSSFGGPGSFNEQQQNYSSGAPFQQTKSQTDNMESSHAPSMEEDPLPF